jgi:hypothetical protein
MVSLHRLQNLEKRRTTQTNKQDVRGA